MRGFLQRTLASACGIRARRTRGSILFWLVCISPAARIVAAQTASLPSQEQQPRAAALSKDHYLLLVNTAMAKQMDARKLKQFDRSPYNGLAISFEDAYDTSPVPLFGAVQTQAAGWKRSTSKHIWPWVYLNRMIGANDAEGNPLTKVPFFERFQGLDLDGKAGARKDFLDNWRNALRLAKRSGVPGIVCDLEFYNNYKAYDLAELAKMTSTSRPEALRMLNSLGAQMAGIAADEYPNATLWLLFTGFTRPGYRVMKGQSYYLAATYIVEGMLDEIQRRHLRLRVLAGGEVGLGYCHTSVENLREAIAKRAAVFAPLLKKYQGALELAGTMTLWSDRPAKKNWVAQGACGASTAGTVEDLIPYMETLFRAYRYNWLYGSPNGGYLAFDPDVSPRFDAAIAQARERAFGLAGGGPGH